MQLNPDCIRDVLLSLEAIVTNPSCTYIFEESEFNNPIMFPRLQSYSILEIAYHIRQCDLYGFLYGAKFPSHGGLCFMDLTPSAHEFLANIRSDPNWQKVKHVAQKVGSFSLEALEKIAEGTVSALIGKFLVP